MRGPRWTEAEHACLLTHWPNIETIAASVGRSEIAVRFHAAVLRKKGYPLVSRQKEKPWTTREEHELLKRWWHKQTTQQIAEALNRSVAAIRLKASELRAKGYSLHPQEKAQRWAPEKVEILREWWGREAKEATAARVGHSVGACRYMVWLHFGSTLRWRWEPEEQENRQAA